MLAIEGPENIRSLTTKLATIPHCEPLYPHALFPVYSMIWAASCCRVLLVTDRTSHYYIRFFHMPLNTYTTMKFFCVAQSDYSLVYITILSNHTVRWCWFRRRWTLPKSFKISRIPKGYVPNRNSQINYWAWMFHFVISKQCHQRQQILFLAFVQGIS